MVGPATLPGFAGMRLVLRVTAGVACVPPPKCRVAAMGLRLTNPLGLAAGFDRDGALLPGLQRCGFGLIEIGTVMTAAGSRSPDTVGAVIAHLARPRGRCGEVPVGVNFASRNDGCGVEALADYHVAMRRLWPFADYLVANLSSPHAPQRSQAEADTRLAFVAALCAARDALADTTGRAVPLAVKLALDPASPRLISRLKATGLDAVIGVTAEPTVVAAAAQALAPVPLISVGGICSAADIALRLACGAALVQVHRAFARGGPRYPRRVLANLEAMRRPRLPDRL